MRIKKHSNGNEYLMTDNGVWVRNFTKRSNPVDINQFTTISDRTLLIENQLKNELITSMQFDPNEEYHQNVCIVSDGYDFANKRDLLKLLPANVTIIGTNRSLVKWDTESKRSMDYYVVNNPYEQCMTYLPASQKNLPKCLASIRTFPDFLTRYRGSKVKYYPVYEDGFKQHSVDAICHIDDYRNPICAAVGLAYRMGAVKILMFCCDDSFADERAGAEKLPNGLWMYPHHRTVSELVDGNMYWYTTQQYKRVRVGNHSSGPECNRVGYIEEDRLNAFFTKEL
jgi:hypothetical protein